MIRSNTLGPFRIDKYAFDTRPPTRAIGIQVNYLWGSLSSSWILRLAFWNRVWKISCSWQKRKVENGEIVTLSRDEVNIF